MPSVLDPRPDFLSEELAHYQAYLDHQVPAKILDRNLLIATWNIRAFGDLTREWSSKEDDSPRRDLQSIHFIAETISRFDVVAVQEVKANIRALRDTLKVLGSHWGLILTDVNLGRVGNGERMAFLFDTRRIQLSGLACELVVPKEWLEEIDENALREQFARSPYAVGFRAGDMTFILVTLHILYGSSSKDRIPELKMVARWMAKWAKEIHTWDHNLIALGDFNIDERGDVLEKTFLSEGLFVPEDLRGETKTRSIFNETKYYDQIAWFNGAQGLPELTMEYLQGGNVDFVDRVLLNKNLSKLQLSWHISDHYPIWAEFNLRK